MPVFNAERHLDAAIESVLADDYGHFELVAIDDGSTDASPAILGRWAARDSRVVVIRQTNQGIAGATNAGLAIARGRYVARMDADDVMLPRMQRQAELLDRDAGIMLVSTYFDLIDENGTQTGRYYVGEDPEITAWLLNFYNVIGGHSQVMFRRDVVRDLGSYRADFAVAEDYDLWTRLAERGRIVVMPFVGLRRRHHSLSASVTEGSRQRASSQAVMVRTLSATLGRELSSEETASVATLWRGAFHPGVIPLARPICRAAFAQFTRENADATQRQRVRFLVARRWGMLAARCAKHGYSGQAMACLGESARWSPIGTISAVCALVRVGVRRLLRTIHPTRA
jgi:hypothetical protein